MREAVPGLSKSLPRPGANEGDPQQYPTCREGREVSQNESIHGIGDILAKQKGVSGTREKNNLNQCDLFLTKLTNQKDTYDP